MTPIIHGQLRESRGCEDMASKITYILVHQARLSDTTVTQDYNLEKEKRKRQLDNNIPPVTLHAKKKNPIPSIKPSCEKTWR